MATKRRTARSITKAKRSAPKRAKARRAPVRPAGRNGVRRPSRKQTERDTGTMMEQALDTAVRSSRKAARKVKEGLSELFSS